MQTVKVIVQPYDKKWKADFEAIKAEIEEVIGDLIVGIEHVGSTAVEGMFAKPIIDIDVIIKDYSVFEKVVCKLSSAGYIHEGDELPEDFICPICKHGAVDFEYRA